MRRPILSLLAAAMVWAGGWLAIRACGPTFVVAVFSYARHPDFPRDQFLNGRLGVLQPTYARSYLVIAYRYLSGVGFSRQEREQVRGYWEDRASGDWDHVETDWIGKWRAARDRIRGVPRPPDRLLGGGTSVYSPDTHSFALNCLGDAYRTATQTLEERSRRFGASSREVREWLAAQNLVFNNCDSRQATVPAPLGDGWPELLRQDRAYQIAAAHFYSRQEKAAAEEFALIAEDETSPWRQISNYLVLRSLYRTADDLQMSQSDTDRVLERADRILGDESLQSIHAMTEALLCRYEVRTRDLEYFHRSAERLASRRQDNGLRDDLWAYTTIWDRFIEDEWSGATRRATCGQ